LAWWAAGPFDPQNGAARSWLYAILRNGALSILRDENGSTSDEMPPIGPVLLKGNTALAL